MKKTPQQPDSVKPAPEQPGTTHKERAEFFLERAAFPFRDAPPLELEKFWQDQNRFGDLPDQQWEPAGPQNIAGRVTALVVPPGEPQTLFAGSAAGGVWRSTDWGVTWDYAWERFANQNIGALAIHPQECDRLIAATGEANQSADTYPGSGFFTSLDGGMKWQNFFTRPGGEPLPRGASEETPRRVGAIAFDPYNLIYGAVGSVTHDERMRAGLYLIRFDVGLIPCIFWGNRSYNCHAVVFHPRRQGWLFAAIELRGSQNGIWRSKNSGETWEHLDERRGLPEGQEFGRASIAFAPSNPEVLYVLAADRERRLLGVFRSSDSGECWERIASPADELFATERFLTYNNTIVVHPNNENFVIWGGANLYRLTGAGQPWTKITTVDRFLPNRVENLTTYVHEDHHALVMPDGDLVYSGNDGGVAVSRDGGDTWEDHSRRSRGMMTTMFYAVDVAPTNSKVFGGGAQDNGTLVTGVPKGVGTNAAMLPEGDFVQAFSGDGGWIVFDAADDQKVFGSFQNANVMRHRRGQNWLRWLKVLDSEKVIGGAESNQRSIAVLALEPGEVAGRFRQLWAGTHRLWRTDDDGATWRPASQTFDRSVISAIEISTVDPRIMYVGTTKGGVYRSTDGGTTWSKDLASADMPRRLITRLETHPTKPQTVVAIVASTGMTSVKLRSTRPPKSKPPFAGARVETATEKPYSHVFQSDDMGITWKDLDGGALPNVVYYAAVFETRHPFRLFLAGDIGVLVQAPGGVGWISITGNLPNVVVSDLVYHEQDQLLTAATYGRGIWRLPTDRLSAGRP